MSGIDVRDRSGEFLVLKSAPYRGQDRLLTLLSPERGVERAVARGAAKPTGSLRAVAQPYTLAALVLSPAKGGLSFLREGQPLRCFLPLDAGLERFAYGAYCCELALSVAQENQPARELFGLLLAAFSLLGLDDDLERTARFFELRLLADQGLLPPLETCQSCGAPLNGKRFFLLSPQAGQLLCDDCLTAAADSPGLPRLSPGAVLTAKRLLELPLERIPALHIGKAIGQELEAALGAYLDYHLEYAPRARRVIRQLQQP